MTALFVCSGKTLSRVFDVYGNDTAVDDVASTMAHFQAVCLALSPRTLVNRIHSMEQKLCIITTSGMVSHGTVLGTQARRDVSHLLPPDAGLLDFFFVTKKKKHFFEFE